ncbi:stage III sporulation protein AD [Ornithinibacillus gellani]|uniref:stage III sporulation protein AD n=1 Tax=Ornithinibacillus gellani TaxID=2293253 RepID=UPI000F46C46C|nr:stage III sporulation protein AD [Ornithinibacillus gellani]TQS74517.1 stage III sporulation protein AD [Ornithinibacillus gellani]
MDIIQIVLLGLIGSILFLLIKDMHATFAFFIMLLTGITIFIIVIQQIGVIFQLLDTLGKKAHIDGIYIATIFRIIGIAYITELGANVTKDAGLSSVASKIELAGKVFILILAIPIISSVVEAILSFLPAT